MAPSTLQLASDTKLEGADSDRSQRRLAGCAFRQAAAK
jgi:hypothetical protein